MDMTQADITDLREELARREAARDDLTDRYMGRPERPAKPARRDPWVRMVEVEGEEYPVDMRRVTSREFVSRVMGLGDRASQKDQMELFQYVFDGMTDEAVCTHVARELGYEDYFEVLRIEAVIFDRLDLKN
ncbi:hypothetical protein [uncultured Parolsenella sp.]|uniref:hypothetical protein n=1 Tax=uncultured Parolsenella sp. TaxID=2083008 RepID=UPI0025E05E32|nr:hypothetical protein [uncultured Parolsenella sp.]